MPTSFPLIAVIGGRWVEDSVYEQAVELGKKIIAADCGVVCGGHGGVMEAVCKGAQEAKKTLQKPALPIIGILKESDKHSANQHVEIAIPTGLGITRNSLVVLAGDGVIAIGGMSGTLSEIAYAWQLKKPVAGLVNSGGWTGKLAGQSLDSTRDDVVFSADTPQAAVDYIITAIK